MRSFTDPIRFLGIILLILGIILLIDTFTNSYTFYRILSLFGVSFETYWQIKMFLKESYSAIIIFLAGLAIVLFSARSV